MNIGGGALEADAWGRTTEGMQGSLNGIGGCPAWDERVGHRGVWGGSGSRGGRGGKGAYRLRIGSWNIGSLTSKSIELAKILQKRKINIACVQETRWVRSRAKNVDGYKLWYSGVLNGKNGEGILGIVNVVSAYAPQAGLDEDIKRHFWEGLDEIVRSIPPSERLFIGGDFNGHIGLSAGGYTEVHGGFGFGERNGGGIMLLDFSKASI
uniref:Craniofacial development protein 2-like n=1 Tax=Nicotiana tabacum TaxID=4097 RepID=A0A1S3Y2K9_TOBAC|nr:PREDICTED: craniofacial development protein 2-like [Nicotiana tabacum]